MLTEWKSELVDWDVENTELELVTGDKRGTLSKSHDLYRCQIPVNFDDCSIRHYVVGTFNGTTEVYPVYRKRSNTSWSTVRDDRINGGKFVLFEVEVEDQGAIKKALKKQIRRFANGS